MFAGDEKQLDRITHLIDDMLDITRISSGKLSVNLEQFDLCELVSDLVERNSEQVVAAGCTVDMEVCQPVIGNWDRFRIEQVVMNLLTNAMRYGAGKSILIQVNASKAEARIVVRDLGRGIAKENHERIFQRFERAVSGSEISGLGLGLYIVRQILETHHGSIRVESELGQGATFVVALPLIEQNGVVHHV
jgi:signal transduction histidine kinase